MYRLLVFALTSALSVQVAPLIAASGASATRAAGVQAPVTTGIIEGTAQSGANHLLSNQKVQVRDLQTGKLAGTSTSNAEGGFSFGGLPPALYVVEVVDKAGNVVGSNAARPVVAGGTVKMAVTATAAVAGPASAGNIPVAAAVKTAAAAAGISGVVTPADRIPASPSR